MQLARVALVRLTPLMVQSAYARLETSGLASRTVFQTHAVLHRDEVLDDVVRFLRRTLGFGSKS
jgi:hypothetical protein